MSCTNCIGGRPLFRTTVQGDQGWIVYAPKEYDNELCISRKASELVPGDPESWYTILRHTSTLYAKTHEYEAAR